LKGKIYELDTNSNIKNHTGLSRNINEFKKGFQHETNLVKDEKGDLLADSNSIWNR
jgi:hypothetical protein